MSLFEIVVVTSTEKACSFGFSFLTSKKEENFTWVLQNRQYAEDDCD